jgi:hypothetical protein
VGQHAYLCASRFLLPNTAEVGFVHTSSSMTRWMGYFKRPVDFKRSPLEIMDAESRMSRIYDDYVGARRLVPSTPSYVQDGC